MTNSKKLIQITIQTIFVIVLIYFSTLNAKNLDKFGKADNISDYFSGIILLNESKYEESFNYLKKLDGLEDIHSSFPTKYLYSLVNSGNFSKAFNYSKKLERDGKGSYETDIILGVFYFKNQKFNLSNKYFEKAKNRGSRSTFDYFISQSLLFWSNLNINDIDKSSISFEKLDKRFINLKKIQKVFLSCYLGNKKTSLLFEELVTDNKIDFSRYYFFYAKYLESIGEKNKAKKIIISSLNKFPRNLLLNQYKFDFETNENNFEFNCINKNDVVAEILYIGANALSSQSIYDLSNFYLNLSKYLNKDFHAFDTLLAENFYKINDFSRSKRIYQGLINRGKALKWYSNKQISRILIKEEKKEEAINLLDSSFNDLKIKGIYEIFDYAEFLKNNERFKKSIKYYTDALSLIDKKHPLYPEVTDGRGIAYERSGDWDKAEKDLLASLEVSPDQAYVINYLAYSWIEKGIKIEKSLEMLEKANKLKSNDPYIIDSLGWALYKLKRYKESKNFLQQAVKLMPADPIVNDHFGDVLWKNGNKLQARYYWSYVLNLEKAEKELIEKVEQKLIKGL